MSGDWLLELGHTRLKCSRLDDTGRLGRVHAMPHREIGARLPEILSEAGGNCWLSAVVDGAVLDSVIELVISHGAGIQRIGTGSAALPVAPAYPGLGVDRWLALQSPWRRQGGAFCVVDAGSATTIDLVDDRGLHLGGWILPGREAARAGLLARAPGLNRPAADLPEALSPQRDTARAIESGLMLQQAGAVGLAVASAGLEPASLPLFLTGGDAPVLHRALAATGSVKLNLQPVESHLVLEGLALAVAVVRGRS